jgi:MFS family permease
MYAFAILAQRTGRKPAFAVCFVAALLSTTAVFYFLNDFHEVFWMLPIMGFCILSLFAGYAIYFPELFPTHLRSTGTSFCYNVGRFVAAIGPGLLGYLTKHVYAHTAEPLRYAGLTMCGIFVIGLCVVPFAPETKDQPLPE